MPSDRKISRRTWLTKVAFFMAATGVLPKLASASPTEEKASKSSVHYRDYPNHMQMCGMCKFFEGGGMMGGGKMGGGMMGDGMMGDGMMGGGMMGGGMMGHGMMAGECEIVKGRISHMGWCDLYAPRGS